MLNRDVTFEYQFDGVSGGDCLAFHIPCSAALRT